MPPKEMHKIQMMYAVYADGKKEPIVIDEIKDLSLEEAEPILEEHNFVKVVRCKDCMFNHWHETPNGEKYHICNLNQLAFSEHDDFYCAYGERRKEDDIQRI